jgi:hypothetical protein
MSAVPPTGTESVRRNDPPLRADFVAKISDSKRGQLKQSRRSRDRQLSY